MGLGLWSLAVGFWLLVLNYGSLKQQVRTGSGSDRLAVTGRFDRPLTQAVLTCGAAFPVADTTGQNRER